LPLLNTPTYALQPAAERVALSSNYITNFDFLNQYLPDTYEKEFERYGNRTISSFLRLVGAEMPSNSDQIKWAEQGRLHIKYTSVGSAALVNANTAVFQINDAGVTSTAIREGQTVFIQVNATGTPPQVAYLQEKLYDDTGSTTYYTLNFTLRTDSTVGQAASISGDTLCSNPLCALFLPTPGHLTQAFATIKNSVITKVPFNYAAQALGFANYASSSASSTLLNVRIKLDAAHFDQTYHWLDVSDERFRRVWAFTYQVMNFTIFIFMFFYLVNRAYTAFNAGMSYEGK